MNEHVIDEVIGKYEQLFAADNVPDCEMFLSGLSETKLNCDTRCSTDNPLFVELLHTDLELRIRNGLDGRVEYYLSRFPQIATDDDLVNNLIMTEFKVRQHYEPGLELDEYADRFPTLIFVSESGTKVDAGNETQTGLNGNSSPSHSDQAARFRKSHLHQKGGLGNVYLAEDTELNRPVAIKEIQSKYARSQAHRSRFARETLITSQLEHPGVVPVYGLGHRNDGTPYFAMQFIEGKTLKSAIAEYHELATQSSNAANLEFRRLLQRFLDVCNTVHYAHSQGIIHRDLKPGNIMIGPFGKTYVVDWGLAKMVSDDDESSLKTNGMNTSSSFQNQKGDTVSDLSQVAGSPGFMSPEQSTGDHELIGFRSDVYSLGATLLNLISNQSPPDTSELSSDRQLSRFKIVSAHKRLKSVCTKAMAFHQDDRYANVESLAEDIENFLLDQPLEAHPDSVWGKLGRFARNHRAIINTATLAMAAMLLLAVISAIWINYEKQEAILAKTSAVLERSKTENALQHERSAKQSADASKLEAEKRTQQLTKTIRIFTQLFDGTDKQGRPRDLDEMCMNDAMDELEVAMKNHKDPIVRAYLNSMLASRPKHRGDVEQAASMNEKALELLQETGIPETDPLFITSLLGHGNAELAARRVDKALEIAELAVELGRTCGVCPDCGRSHRPLLLRALELQHRAAKLKKQATLAEESLNEAFDLAQCVFEDESTEPLMMKIKYHQAENKMRAGKHSESRQIFHSIIEPFESRDLVHVNMIASRLGLAALEFQSNNLDGAERQLERAFTEAVTIFGENHVQTNHVKSQYAAALSMSKDPGKQSKGIASLVEIHEANLKNGNKSRAVNSAITLAGALNRRDAEANLQAVIALLQKTLEQKYTASSVGPSNMWTLYLQLGNAYRNSGQKDQLLQVMQKQHHLAVEMYGADSKKVDNLKKRMSLLEESMDRQ